jgi:hypothetical protein
VVPVSLFVLAQVLALGGSVALCAWLLIGPGRNLLRRLASGVQRRHTAVAAGVAIGVVLLVVQSLAFASQAWIVSYVDPRTARQIFASSSYASVFMAIVQMVALLALTLVLVRRRFLLRHA